MRVYKSKYMPENTIYQLNGRKILDRVTQGRCLHPSVFEGYSDKHETLYQYDANSLFPTIQEREGW